MKVISILFSVGFFILSCTDVKVSDKCDCEPLPEKTDSIENWELFLSGDTTVPAFPDVYVNYFTYSLVLEDNYQIRIQGKFPEARYMSINIYDSNEGSTLNEIYDINIEPDCCSYNPFQDEDSNGSLTSEYTINIVQEQVTVGSLMNVLTIPSGIDSLSIFLRYYDSFVDEFANVDLPAVTIINNESGQLINNPNIYFLRDVYEDGHFDNLLTSLFPLLQLDDNIRFYNFSARGVFTNSNTSYLAAGITKSPDEVYMIRFIPPSYPLSQLDYSITESRFWSINQGNEHTNNFFGMKDEQFIIADSDGFVNIVISDSSEDIIQKCDGLNFLPWKVPGENMFLIYRNVLQSPDFEGNFNQVPIFNAENVSGFLDFYNLNAINFIGDFAPIGLRMTKEEFLTNFGGFPVSY